ncbi:MAG: DUF4180 domain-containing protein, partial [Gammaproteobacteria bacterium]|nr:DUF4180 domain-containing protein [Gammaproteobacteria bacterium]
IGDFTNYTSNSLQAFIRESNRGSLVFFEPDREAALEKINATLDSSGEGQAGF